MRTRIWLTSAAMGAVMLVGGVAATAQAAPAPSGTGAASTTVIPGWIPVPGTYPSLRACQADGENSAQTWKCVRQSNGRYKLYVMN
ncbi:hypothetical protein AB0F13_22695 [Streptomyces sp. NPDC026206]|uniref:hypothetical protein n=1 Tax=Streptomyces sp. NPDC026206 TaxID=3157089 RepID=UPI0033EFB943